MDPSARPCLSAAVPQRALEEFVPEQLLALGVHCQTVVRGDGIPATRRRRARLSLDVTAAGLGLGNHAPGGHARVERAERVGPDPKWNETARFDRT